MTDALVSILEKASYAYHNGLPQLMTDAAFDAAVDKLRDMSPDHPFLSKVGAPVPTADEVELPIPLPSLNKIKDQAAILKWISKDKHVAPSYHVSAKLDGCSALWLPQIKKLYTRGDGMRGRDISAFAPYFVGLVASPQVTAVRGELIMRAPAGKLARNIVAGALNRKEVDKTLFAEIRFIAYELLNVAVTPEAGFKLLRAAGYETARAAIVTTLDATSLSQIFDAAEAKSPYQMDGIVVAPNLCRPADYKPLLRNPTDRVAWKTRLTAQTARTIVRAVEWNISHGGYLIPRVLFDTVTLAGANIGAATGLHGRWIYDNGVGPGAEIEVRRAGDVIPQIIAVHSRAPAGAAMPKAYIWANGVTAGTDPTPDCIHVAADGVDAATATASACVQLTHALGELGAENVGPGIVANLYAAGFDTLQKIYMASVSDLATKVAGCKDKGAERIYAGLRAKRATWTELNFMVASCTMPRSVGHTKLTPLLAIESQPALWTAAALKAQRPAGLSDKTIDAIVDAIPAYLAWKTATGLSPSSSSSAPAPILPGAKVVVFTGVRDKVLEAALLAKGYVIADTVTKKTTHLIYADGSTSTKLIKAKEMGITTMTLTQAKAEL